MNLSVERGSAVDPLRMLLAIFVIGVHTGFPDGLPDMVKQVLVNGIYRTAVPVFAVISGYFFLGAIRSGRAGRYLRRILVLYLLWMVIYLPRYVPAIDSAEQIFRLWFFGYFHLWFLPGILFAGLAVLTLARCQAGPRAIAGLAAGSALAGLVLQHMVLTGRLEVPVEAYRNGVFVIFPYFATGYLLALGRDRIRLPRRRGMIVAACLLAVMAESLIWRGVAGGLHGIDNMLSQHVAAPVLFLVALDAQGWRGGKRIAVLSAFTYFLHVHMMFVATGLGLGGNAKSVFVASSCLAVFWLLNALTGRRVLNAVT